MTVCTRKHAEIVKELEAVGRTIADHSRQVLTGKAADWAAIAEQLASAARSCRTQVTYELADIGDSGGR